MGLFFGIFGFLGFIVFLIMAAFYRKRKDGTAKKMVGASVVCLLLMIVGITLGDASEPATKPAETPAYEITNERLDNSGMWYVDVDSTATTNEEIEGIMEEVKEQSYDKRIDVHSIFLWVHNDDGTINAKLALDNKGLAQTGLDETGKTYIEE